MSGWGVLVAAMALGLIAGVVAGMFGIGGGLIIVPVLVLLFGLDQKTATGTSLFVILLPTGLLGVLEYYRRGELRADVGLWIAIGVLFGGYFGARLTGLLSASQMRRAYAVFLLVVGIYYLATTKDSPSKKSPALAERREQPLD